MDIAITSAPSATHSPAAGCGGDCGCGAAPIAVQVLDVRAIPGSIRHAAVLGAVGAIAPEAALVLIAPHDPVPLLREIEELDPGAITVSYDERGPDSWRVRLTRLR